MSDQGFTVARGWMKFKHKSGSDHSSHSDLKVREAEPSDYVAIGKILATAFDLGEQAENWHTYVTLAEGAVAGTG